MCFEEPLRKNDNVPIRGASPVHRWFVSVIIFIGFDIGGSGVMRLVLDRYDFSSSFFATTLIALVGGICAWLTFHLWRHSHPFFCMAAMGYFSGIAGSGAFVLTVQLLMSLMPNGGISSTIQ